jgi:acyl carrier protein
LAQASSPPPRRTAPVSTAELRELIARIDTVADLKKLTDTTRFRDAGADSLDFYNLIVAIDEEYGITIDDSDLEQVNTLEKLAKYLNERLA